MGAIHEGAIHEGLQYGKVWKILHGISSFSVQGLSSGLGISGGKQKEQFPHLPVNIHKMPEVVENIQKVSGFFRIPAIWQFSLRMWSCHSVDCKNWEFEKN